MTEDVDMQDPGGFPTSSSNESLLDLENVDMDPLTEALRKYSINDAWSYFIRMDTHDSWQGLLSRVLLVLTTILATTSLKRKVIGPLGLGEAEAMVSGFNGEQRKKWKDAMQKGVETDEWADLIQLGMYPPDHPIFCPFLNNIKAKLKNPKVRKVAQGVPIELRVFCFVSFHPLTMLTFPSSFVML
jgi:hypothetical protein